MTSCGARAPPEREPWCERSERNFPLMRWRSWIFCPGTAEHQRTAEYQNTAHRAESTAQRAVTKLDRAVCGCGWVRGQRSIPSTSRISFLCCLPCWSGTAHVSPAQKIGNAHSDGCYLLSANRIKRAEVDFLAVLRPCSMYQYGHCTVKEQGDR
eukprot:301194-Rhodomonas_salina.1